ncbi:MAG: DUF1499 domain-containing protein [Acidobacteria bacterium]|jgi:hypothetical protein|nr:DUF1499 domain-containing protein [Acidobacteriota bacterium]
MNIIKVLGIAAGVVAAGLAGLAVTNPGNAAETSDDAKDESLQTRRYRVDFKTFVEEIKKMIPTLTTYGQNWKLIGSGGSGKDAGSEAESHSATFIIEVPVVFFTDDLEINANKEAEKDEITVNVRSASRLGKSDLGENRRHILQILKALDEKFTDK